MLGKPVALCSVPYDVPLHPWFQIGRALVVFVVSAAFVLPGTVLFAKLSKFRCQIAGGFLLAHLEHERLAFCLFKKEKFEMAQAHNACREAGQISCAHRKATRGDKHNVRRYLFLYRLFIFSLVSLDTLSR